jgi:hypothetical protein
MGGRQRQGPDMFVPELQPRVAEARKRLAKLTPVEKAKK